MSRARKQANRTLTPKEREALKKIAADVEKVRFEAIKHPEDGTKCESACNNDPPLAKIGVQN